MFDNGAECVAESGPSSERELREEMKMPKVVMRDRREGA